MDETAGIQPDETAAVKKYETVAYTRKAPQVKSYSQLRGEGRGHFAWLHRTIRRKKVHYSIIVLNIVNNIA